MSLIARCPEDPKHDLFLATAYVAETWVVGPDGEFMELREDGFPGDVLHRPDRDNEWTCVDCGAVAEHVEATP